jgi:murein DD-endopeptidase MepM/ murein hydrolase activator NlpD
MPVFKSPVGNKIARDAGQIWPAPWEDKNHYGNIYTIKGRTARHPGADLNIASGDLNEKVFAIGPGIVEFAKEITGDSLWGNVVIINHGTVDGKPLFSRYAHLLSIEPGITKGAEVTADKLIGRVGSGPAGSEMDPHLHFDISTTSKLAGNAGDWPGMNEARLLTDYVDPKEWLKGSHVINRDAKGNLVSAEPAGFDSGSRAMRAPNLPAASAIVDWFVVARPHTELRAQLSTPTGNTLPFSFSFPLETNPQLVLHEDVLWVQICDGPLKGHWVKYGNQSKTEVYVSSTRPSP